MKNIVYKYRMALILFVVSMLLLAVKPSVGALSLKIAGENFLEMLKVIPPIFILMGLMDTWVEKESMVKHMGESSGFKGIFLSFMLGSMAAGPLYAAFPVAAMLLKKGTKISNVLLFLGVWSTTKLPMFLFEVSSLGKEFALLRFALNLPIILAIAYITEKFLGENGKKELYERAQNL